MKFSNLLEVILMSLIDEFFPLNLRIIILEIGLFKVERREKKNLTIRYFILSYFLFLILYITKDVDIFQIIFML